MCSGIYYGEEERLVSVGRWSHNRDVLCVVECTVERLRDWSL